ncbi:LysE family translocator [Paucibacter soli]|uniref:LysE family translocator n=1 Tax=Paucibacter soli TaxID=3133433 RepID=UPI0030A55AAE
MQLPDQLPAFVTAALLVIMVPGPATLFVLGQARHGARRAWAAVAGLVLGDALLISAAALGLAALLQRWPALLALLRWGGAAYIAWLGLALLRARAGTAAAAAPAGGFARALLITLGNPKPLLFFGAFFPLFMRRDGEAGWLAQFYLLGGLFELLNIGYFALLLAALRWLPAGTGPWPARLAGAGLLLCALLAALSAS